MSRETKSADARWLTLKRRVIALARLDGAIVELAEGLHVCAAKSVRDADRLLVELEERGAPTRATFEDAIELARPPTLVTPGLLAVAQRDLRALSTPPARALAREHRKTIARHGEIDDAWLRAKRLRIDGLAARLETWRPRTPETWFDGAREIVRALHGDDDELAAASERLVAEGAARRALATARLEAILGAMQEGTSDPELAQLALRLERLADRPGRARRARALAILREELGVTDAPKETTLAERTLPWIDALREAGLALVRLLPAKRDDRARRRAETMLAWYGLHFRTGALQALGPAEVERALEKREEAKPLARYDLTIAQALALVELPLESWYRRQAARLVEGGLEIESLAAACSSGHAKDMIRTGSVRGARAYATWATRLVPHYAKLGVSFTLTPELFSNLPRNEDLGVLALCLMDAHLDRKIPDALATLDATLGLFQKLPAKASGILARLRGTEPGAGRASFPDLADWLEEDELLDRYVHLARLSGLPVALGHRVREDFEHATKSARERAHLEALPNRSSRQEARLTALLAVDRSRAASPKGRTRRRIAARVEELLPIAYKRELDLVFREILREAWGIDIPRLTPAWRDAVRFWLVVDDNRDLLGQLLRAAARAPGRDVKRAIGANEAWIEAARRRFAVDAWLAPRREAVPGGFVIACEEDPLEVLRMGIPFGTCLSLEDGCNAASTVVNATDANKRVVYVRSNDGTIIGRKLLAIDEDDRIIGYQFYLSVRGGAEQAIRSAMTAFCLELASQCGLSLKHRGGPPRRLNGTFWYDDGTVPFDEDVEVSAYCRALGLTPPATVYEAIALEARGRAAIVNADVERAADIVTRWDDGAANRAVGRFVATHLGERDAAKRAMAHPPLIWALLTKMAEDVEGLLRALALAPRLEPDATSVLLPALVARFPPDPRIARALAVLATRAVARGSLQVARKALGEVSYHLGDLDDAFDVLDEADGAWTALEEAGGCEPCVSPAVTLYPRYDRAPDAEPVARCLALRTRSRSSHLAALYIASRHLLPNGARALERLGRLRPDFLALEDLAVARLRHGLAPSALSVGLRAAGPASAPAPEGPIVSFESLRDLVLTLPDLARYGRWDDLASWKPGSWELAWLRRNPVPELRSALLDEAKRAPLRASRALELLALMADRKAVAEIARLPFVERHGAPTPASSDSFPDVDACAATSASLARQVDATRASRLEVPGAKVDRVLSELAAKFLGGQLPHLPKREQRALVLEDRTKARAVLVAETASMRWGALVACCIEKGDVESASALLARVSVRLTPSVAIAAWRFEALREPLATYIARDAEDCWAACTWALEREAGPEVEGLFEAVARARLATYPTAATVTEVETPDQLRSILQIVVTELAPEVAVSLYDDLSDELTASLFLRAMARAPRERAAAIREAGKRRSWSGPRGAARRAWLEATRLHSSAGSSIEREG